MFQPCFPSQRFFVYIHAVGRATSGVEGLQPKLALNVLDLFSGCGGMSLGFAMSGCEVAGAVDIDATACDTYRKNLGLAPLCGDLRNVRGTGLLENFGLKTRDVDVVVGCPPCQTFSSLHRTKGVKKRVSGTDLVEAFTAVVKDVQPSVVVFENVPGLLVYRGGQVFKSYLLNLERKGYVSTYSVVNAADYGVPQHRRRLVCVSFKTDKHVKEDGFSAYKSGVKLTVRHAIADLPPLKSGESHPSVPNHRSRSHSERVLELIGMLPRDGGSRRDLPKRFWLPCHEKLERRGGGAGNVYGRMWWDKPAPTLTTRCTTPSSGRFVHPEQDRAITPREAARLQTFPDTFVFPEDFASAERLVGNAFPPLLVRNCLAPFIMEHLHLL